MTDTRPTSMRLTPELIMAADEIAKIKEWSRSQVLVRAVEFGLPLIIVGGEKKSVAPLIGDSVELVASPDLAGHISAGHHKRHHRRAVDAENATGGGEGVAAAVIPSGNKSGVRKGASYVNRELLRGKSVSEVAAVGAGGGFRGPGKCPHGWANWLSCPECNPNKGDK